LIAIGSINPVFRKAMMISTGMHQVFKHLLRFLQ
jgi:hypothetical protein